MPPRAAGKVKARRARPTVNRAPTRPGVDLPGSACPPPSYPGIRRNRQRQFAMTGTPGGCEQLRTSDSDLEGSANAHRTSEGSWHYGGGKLLCHRARVRSARDATLAPETPRRRLSPATVYESTDCTRPQWAFPSLQWLLIWRIASRTAWAHGTTGRVVRRELISGGPRSSGKLRRVPESSGEFRRTPESSGELRRAPESSGELRRASGKLAKSYRL